MKQLFMKLRQFDRNLAETRSSRGALHLSAIVYLFCPFHLPKLD